MEHDKLRESNSISGETRGISIQGFTRRDFLITLGLGTTAVISGFFLVGTKNKLKDTMAVGSEDRSTTPRVLSVIRLTKDGEMTLLQNPLVEGSTLCAVNSMGAEILRHLDGTHTIRDIAKTVSKKYKTLLTETLETNIAYFVTQVGENGFLQEPFRAYIVERYTEA